MRYSRRSRFIPGADIDGTVLVHAASTLAGDGQRCLLPDGFVAWNMFHHDPDATLAYWRSFAGWMIYWAGQAAICFGAIGLHKAPART
jgi:hypothetical protein